MSPASPPLSLIAGTGDALVPVGVNEILTPDLKSVFDACARLAQFHDVGVLLLGEPGVGKTAIARHIHNLPGKNLGRPFVVVDVPQVAGSVFESVLFGHKKGSFTGAQSDHDGLILQAHKGTLFFDEIGDLPLDLQAKLLRVIEEKTFKPVGSNRDVTSDFRLIAATNRDLEKMVAEGAFRKDLYDRIDTFPVTIPPLRERPNDILPLAAHFLKVALWKYEHRDGKDFSAEAKTAMQSYHWPGNVRELEKRVLRALISSGDSAQITPSHLDFAKAEEKRAWLFDPVPAFYERDSVLESLRTVRTWPALEMIENTANRLQTGRALAANDYFAGRTAIALGLPEDTLKNHLRRLFDMTKFGRDVIEQTITNWSLSNEEKSCDSVIRDLAQAPNRDTITTAINAAKLRLLNEALEETKGNQQAAENLIGLRRGTLRHHMAQLSREVEQSPGLSPS